jgi:N-dimethylarginine dimethylaminohydrolase
MSKKEPSGSDMAVGEQPYTHVEVTHEWGKLEDVIVGIQPRDRFIIPKLGLDSGWDSDLFARLCNEQYGKQLIDVDPETAIAFEAEIEGLVALLARRGVKVRRVRYPEGEDDLVGCGTGEGTLIYARDPILVVGNRIIELTASEGWRERERFAVRPVIAEIMENSNACWAAMPPPAPSLSPDAPRLEGGDVLLNGAEIYVGCSGVLTTSAGVRWLRQYLGDAYEIHQIPLVDPWMHLDGAICLLRDGLALRAPEFLNEPLPGALSGFEFIDVNPFEASKLGCNVLILDENTIIMDTGPCSRLAREIEKHGIEVIHHDYELVHAMGGGLRCSHHPIRRVVA